MAKRTVLIVFFVANIQQINNTGLHPFRKDERLDSLRLSSNLWLDPFLIMRL